MSRQPMRFIAHRGNVTGRNVPFENSPDYIRHALDLGFDVEVDVWCEGSKFYLGHDEPQHEIRMEFLHGHRMWCHAKNIEALAYMRSDDRIHCFWHQNDDVTLTSQGYIWTYPGKQLTEKSVCVMPEWTATTHKDHPYSDISLLHCSGICSDLITYYRAWYAEQLNPPGE